jgi:membrane protease YdiL (CAAX protease family)
LDSPAEAPASGVVQILRTAPAETLAWMRTDLPARLLPFALTAGLVQVVWRPRWLGLSPGDLGVQLAFGLAGGILLFGCALVVQVALSRRRGAIRVPDNAADAALQSGYFILNGALEEAFFRGLVQGGLAALTTPWLGFAIGTAAYTGYHRLGGWTWLDTAATALLGVPLGLAFWLLPGPPSLLGVAIAHVGATCGFLGPGPYLLAKRGRLR